MHRRNFPLAMLAQELMARNASGVTWSMPRIPSHAGMRGIILWCTIYIRTIRTLHNT